MSNAKNKEKSKEIKKATKVDKKPKKEKKQSFFKGVKQELSKVKWPTAKDVAKYAVATLALCILLGLFFEALTIISTLIKGLF